MLAEVALSALGSAGAFALGAALVLALWPRGYAAGAMPRWLTGAAIGVALAAAMRAA